MQYSVLQAAHFVAFALIFSAAFMYAAWRIVRKFEKRDAPIRVDEVDESKDE